MRCLLKAEEEEEGTKGGGERESETSGERII